MKKLSGKTFLFLLALLVFFWLFAGQYPIAAQQYQVNFSEAWESCTSIMVGKKASVDGSVITCHTCDGRYRTWVEIVPHQTHDEGSMRKILWGTMFTETAWDLRGIREKGEITQVKETYAYLNVCYPCLNEKQLAFGETTIMGKRELRNDEGMFVIEELQRIALERCTTAREAIRLMGNLATNYGYGDWGECLTVADPKEVWHFEIFGAGLLEIGAVWAAVRIPDDHVGVSANMPRISTLNLDDPDHYMASENVFSLAEEMEWWSPDSGEFKFWKAYSGRDKAFGTREFYILSTLAPSLNLSMDAEELPFCVKPEKKLSVRDVMKYYRETYAGTEFDMTQNLMVPKPRRGRRGQPQEDEAEKDEKVEMIKSPLANPWMSRDMIRMLNAIKPGTVERQRTIAIAGCSYSQIIQLRDWLPDEIGGVAWFSFDNPALSPRIPIFAGVLELPKSFNICAQHRFRTDAACWAFRRANRLATINWGRSQEIIEESVMEFENKAFDDLPMIEAKALELYKKEMEKLKKENNAKKDSEEEVDNENGEEPPPPEYKKYLTKYTNDFARAAIDKWWELGDTFWGMFGRGF